MIKNVIETLIAAPPREVFRIICNFEGYPAWNPFTPRVIGKCEPGAIVDVTVKLKGAPFQMNRRIVEVVPDTRFAWEGAAWYSRLVPGLRSVTCIDDGKGGTRVVDDEELRGISFLMSAELTETIRMQMVAFGQGLKQRAEQGAARAGAAA